MPLNKGRSLPINSPMTHSTLVWFRRDLRIDDNASLNAALSKPSPLAGAFVFDQTILARFPSNDRRVDFIAQSVRELAGAFAKASAPFFILLGDPAGAIPALASALGCAEVYAGRDYEPSATGRDRICADALLACGSNLVLRKEHVLFEDAENLSLAKTPFTVFTPFKNAWLKNLRRTPLLFDPKPALAISRHAGSFPWDPQLLEKAARLPCVLPSPPSAADLGFSGLSPIQGGSKAALARAKFFAPLLAQYASGRDSLALAQTSCLGTDLRFGTVSPRRLAAWALAEPGAGPETWLSELAWRDFWSALLSRCPSLAAGSCFQPAYDNAAWPGLAEHFEKWTLGQTGVPLVDAGMRELAATGLMHNRARMVCASFLSKQLECDWKWGEDWFAKNLMDYDQASNIGNWQWCAGVGADAQPYFRVFNPLAQSKKFDPGGTYLRKWVPEIASLDASKIHEPWDHCPAYPRPIVDLKNARESSIAWHKSQRG